MPNLRYALSQSTDPEELLEVAMMWKALFDTFGKGIHPLRPGEMPGPGNLVFGLASDAQRHAAGTGLREDYWNIPAFRSRVARSFALCTFDEAQREVTRLGDMGKGAFVKSIRRKEFIGTGEPGCSLTDIMGEMAFSHLDYPHPTLMVQERVAMTCEYRCAVVAGRVVTSSPVVVSATPNLAHSHQLRGYDPCSILYRSPMNALGDFEADGDLTAQMRGMAAEIASECELVSGTIDIALIDGERIEPIEMNIGYPGGYGLFFCDPYAIARAARSIVPESVLAAGPPAEAEGQLEISTDEEAWPDEDFSDEPAPV